VQRWKPCGGGGGSSRVVRVACGRAHTVAVDDRGRIWTLGDAKNRHGQLGRRAGEEASEPEVVELPVPSPSSPYRVESVSCGWHHTVVVLRRPDDGSALVYGWGRNDLGQLGTGSTENVPSPRRLFEAHRGGVQSVDCGSEFTSLVDDSGRVWSCGWNEHGNLAAGGASDRCCALVPAAGVARVARPPGYPDDAVARVAAGGSHAIAMRVAPANEETKPSQPSS
jgi:alpha-tubulin suppressor-like RCC1 family protein